MRKLNINKAVLKAIKESDDSLARYQNQALTWAKECERDIGSALGYKVKAKTINITGSYMDLPADCYKVIGVFVGDYEDEANLQYKDLDYVKINVDTREGEDVYDRDLTMYWKPMEVNWIAEHHWEEIGDQLHLIGSFRNQDFTLVYKYIETDIDGNWLVNESHIDACNLYIQFMYANKYQWKFFKGDKLLRAGHGNFVDRLDFRYNQAIRNARAEDGAETKFDNSRR